MASLDFFIDLDSSRLVRPNDLSIGLRQIELTEGTSISGIARLVSSGAAIPTGGISYFSVELANDKNDTALRNTVSSGNGFSLDVIGANVRNYLYLSESKRGLLNLALTNSGQTYSIQPLPVVIRSNPSANQVNNGDTFISNSNVNLGVAALVSESTVTIQGGTANITGNATVSGGTNTILNANMAVWGAVSGNITDQADLVAALATKLDFEYNATNSITIVATGNALWNGSALKAAVATAASLPAPKVYLLLPEAEYDLGTYDEDDNGVLELSTYEKPIGLVGLSTDARKQHVFGHTDTGASEPSLIRIHPEADLKNIFIEQLAQGSLGGGLGDCVCLGLNATTTDIHTGTFQNVIMRGPFGRTTQFFRGWDGLYIDVVGQRALLFCNGRMRGVFIRVGSGGENVLIGAIADGLFIDCYGGPYSLGGQQMNGTWIRCRGGYGSFGGEPGSAYYNGSSTSPVNTHGYMEGCEKINGSFPIDEFDTENSGGMHLHNCVELTGTEVSLNQI